MPCVQAQAVRTRLHARTLDIAEWELELHEQLLLPGQLQDEQGCRAAPLAARTDKLPGIPGTATSTPGRSMRPPSRAWRRAPHTITHMVRTPCGRLPAPSTGKGIGIQRIRVDTY